MTTTIHFFIGKGGVGKSTTSALTALGLAQTGVRTLLVSMDPAHNQRDILQCRFSDKPKEIAPKLKVIEVDVDHWVAAFLKETQTHLKKAYSYQGAFNIQNYYNILKFSPGLEEYALLLAFKNVLQNKGQKDAIVFDMPPTALTLRFFSLPFITLIWLEELLKLRTQIMDKKQIVSKIKLGQKKVEQDKVKTRLASLIDDHRQLRGHFQCDSTCIHLVLNNDRLSLAEAIRIRKKLDDIGIGISSVVLNKVKNGETIEHIEHAFTGYPLKRFFHSRQDLYGLDALEVYLQQCACRPEICSPALN